MSNYPFCYYTIYEKHLYINLENSICMIIRDKNMSYKETIRQMVIDEVFGTLFMDFKQSKFILSHIKILNDAPNELKRKLKITY